MFCCNNIKREKREKKLKTTHPNQENGRTKKHKNNKCIFLHKNILRYVRKNYLICSICNGKCRPHQHTQACTTLHLKTQLIKKYYLLLTIMLSGDVETNPGPELTICTYNVRGLKCDKKSKTFLNKCYEQFRKCPNMVICIQETHMDEKVSEKLNTS